MKLPKQVANPGLAALIQGSGFSSLERFANAVNLRGWHMHGVKLSYDHISVKRWLAGSICQNPDVMAAVLSDAWGVPVPVDVIWPELRNGRAPVPAHLHPWVAARTLENLGALIGTDMLTRRQMLAEAISLATGNTLTEPIARWLGTPAVGLPATNPSGPDRIGMTDVIGVERATRYFATSDAQVGGGLTREAAVGQLKYAVDLARHASYTPKVGHRLLAAIADLSGWVGWMSHDVAMEAPAQRYFVYGLQAARESADDRGQFRAVGILCDMAVQMFMVGRRYDTGLRLLDLAFDQLPRDGRRVNKVRAHLWSLRALGFAGMGSTYAAEARSAIGLSFDLHAQLHEDDFAPVVAAYFPYVGPAELAHTAGASYRQLAQEDRKYAADAERHMLDALHHRPDGFTRSRVFDQIELAKVRFAADEPQQACQDGEAAIQLAGTVAASSRVERRLQELRADSQPYRDHTHVREFREKLRVMLAEA